MEQKPSTEKSLWAPLLIIFLFALVIRVGYVSTLGNDAYWSDELGYHEIAQHLLDGDGYITFLDNGGAQGGPTAYRAPAQVWMLAGLYILFGRHMLVGRLFQSLLSAALVLLAYAISREIGLSRRAALLAALITGLYPFYVYCSGALYPVTIAAFFLAVMTLCMLKGRNRHDYRFESLAGAFLAAAVLSLPYVIGAVPLLVLWILANKNSSRSSSRACIALTVTCVILVAPWVVRNKIVMGKAMITSNFASNFWAGNNPESTWTVGSDVTVPPELLERLRAGYEMDASAIYMEVAAKEIRSHPWRYFTLSMAKAVNFFRPYPNPAKISPNVTIQYKVIGLATYGPVLILAIWQLLGDKRRRALYALFLCSLAPAVAASAITISKDRFRYPFDVYLIILAAAMVENWLPRKKNGKVGEKPHPSIL